MPTLYDVMAAWTDPRAPGSAGYNSPQSHRIARYATRAEAEADLASMPAPLSAHERREVWTVDVTEGLYRLHARTAP